MYFVDRELLEQRIQFMEQLFSWLETFQQVPINRIEQLALERALHMTIEAILDIGNQMIDGFIMRDPGSFEDIIFILEDEQVIDSQDKDVLVPFIQCRKALVSDYLQIDYQSMWALFVQAKASLDLFPDKIRTYLYEQLGPVSAFRPERN